MKTLFFIAVCFFTGLVAVNSHSIVQKCDYTIGAGTKYSSTHQCEYHCLDCYVISDLLCSMGQYSYHLFQKNFPVDNTSEIYLLTENEYQELFNLCETQKNINGVSGQSTKLNQIMISLLMGCVLLVTTQNTRLTILIILLTLFATGSLAYEQDCYASGKSVCKVNCPECYHRDLCSKIEIIRLGVHHLKVTSKNATDPDDVLHLLNYILVYCANNP